MPENAGVERIERERIDPVADSAHLLDKIGVAAKPSLGSQRACYIDKPANSGVGPKLDFGGENKPQIGYLS